MGLQRKTVLVVEDHPRLRAAIRKVLLQMGLDVVESPDGRSALNCLATSTPDLILLAMVLPETSGYELCESIRSSPSLRDVPVLAMSERASPAERAYAAEVGASAFLPRPFDDDELRARVDSLLGGKANIRLRAGLAS